MNKSNLSAVGFWTSIFFAVALRASGWIISPWISVPAWTLTAVLGIFWLILHYHDRLPKIQLVWPGEKSICGDVSSNDNLQGIINDLKQEIAELKKQLESKQTDELEEEIIGLLIPGTSFNASTIPKELGIESQPGAEKQVRIALARLFNKGNIKGTMGSFIKINADNVTKKQSQ